MSALTMFGVASVSAMLVSYALEERSRGFVLAFAFACAASSLYGFLQGAWPFGVVEAIWTAVAVRRWHRRRSASAGAASTPVACDMSALSVVERNRYDVLRGSVTAATREAVETSEGLKLRLDTSVSLPDVAEWIALERRCCPFLRMRVDLPEHGQDAWVELTGSSVAARSFIREEFTLRLESTRSAVTSRAPAAGGAEKRRNPA